MCKAGAKLFRQFLSGEYGKWNLAELKAEINIYDKIERLRLQGSLVKEVANDEVDTEGQFDKDVDNVADPNVSVDNIAQN